MGRWVIPPEVHGNGRFVIPRREFVPAYLKTYEEGRLKEKVEEALSHLGPSCRVCPRLCKGVNRLENAFGVCRVGRYARVASAFPHFGEEDVLRGWRGSGTIFFSWCNLRCVFCVAPETMIATEEGPLPIREIYERGDRELDYAGGQVRFFEKPLRVFTRLGRLACVSKAFRHPFEGHLIQIQPYYCPPLLLTPNHEVFAVHPSAPDQVRKIRADQLTREHWLLVPKRIGWEPVERLEVQGILSQEKVRFRKKGLPRYFYQDVGDFYLIQTREIHRKIYKGWVYNLEISDPDHSYVASFVAVSNCQNYEISQLGEGEELTPKELARLMIRLQEMGCHNINFVTPEHVVPQIVEALPYAIEMGLRVPLVYNTSAYDSLESLRVMEGLVDIYMPDFKLWTPERSRKYLLAANYPEVARQAIAEMHRQVGELRVDEDGLAVRGVLVRHLVMPGLLDETREIMRWLAGLSRDTYVNLMDQYYPAWKAKTDPRYAEINRRVFRREMEEAFRIAREAGLWRFDVRWRMVIPGLEWIAIE